jgi:hypothetical protein
MKKTYTLELTAEELAEVDWGYFLPGPSLTTALRPLVSKVKELAAQAKADREADELRLPWKAVASCSITSLPLTCLQLSTGVVMGTPTEPIAKLMSAAPELLKAVKAFNEWRHRLPENTYDDSWRAVHRHIVRALRKVETGIPEDE